MWWLTPLAFWPAPSTTAPVREAAGASVDADEDGWRRLGEDRRRDLAPVTQRRMQELAVYLWESNRLANRLIELPLAYLLAEGVKLVCEDEEAQGWLDGFWADPINRLDHKLEARMRALSLFGEALWPAFVGPDGSVRLGYADPAAIERVVLDPENGEQPIVIVTRVGDGRRRLYRVIVAGGDEDDLFPPGSGARKIRDRATDGEAFYLRINALPNGRRGRSDLLSAVDFCDAYEQFLFGELERAIAARSVVWDVTLTGATEADVTAKAASIPPPRPNSVRVHNEAEKWQPMSAHLGAYEAGEVASMIRRHVLGGSSIPEHWYGSGGDVNRATASEMGDPAEKVLTLRQRFWGGVLADVGGYVIRRRADAGGRADMAGRPECRVRAQFPELTSEDTSRYAAALGQVVAGVGAAIDRELMTAETGLALVAQIAGRLGIDIDAKAELERARAGATDRDAAGYEVPPDLAGDGEA